MSNPSSWSSIKHLSSSAWTATFKARAKFILFLSLFVFATITELLSPWAIGLILGTLVENGLTEDALSNSSKLIALYVGLRLLKNFLHHCARYFQQEVAYVARMSMMQRLFSSIMSFPLKWHVSHHSGENLSKLHRTVGAIDQVIGTFVWQIIEGIIKILFAGIAIAALDTIVALNVFGMCLVTVLVMMLFNRRLITHIRSNNSFGDKLNRFCIDFLFNIVTVKTLHLEKASEEGLVHLQPRGLALTRSIARFQEFKWGAVSIGESIVLGSSLWIYLSAREGLSGALDIAQIYVLLNYLDRVFQAVGSFTGYYGGILEAATAHEDGHKILKEHAEQPLTKSQTRLPQQWNEFNLHKLNFSYAEHKQEDGLVNANITIKKGEKIALIGPSGSGKSTLLKIVGGMLSTSRYELSVDGSDAFELEDVANTSLILPQEPEIFSNTVGYNLTFGDDYSSETLAFYLKLACVDGVIDKLPKGWDSDLAEKGLNLSVGEKQRLALARGLLRSEGKDIILLDEPTSSLDPATEKKIFIGLLAHFEDRTIMTACHRLSLVPLFDRVVVVKEGAVIESGSFEELLKREGAFAKIWAEYQEQDQGKAEVES